MYCGRYDDLCYGRCVGVGGSADKSYYLPDAYPARTLSIMEFYRRRREG
jgi:hypothetical protein